MRRNSHPTSNSEAGETGASASSAEPLQEFAERAADRVKPWQALVVVVVAALSVAFSVGVTKANVATKDETRALDKRLSPVEQAIVAHEKRLDKLEAIDGDVKEILRILNARSTP